MKSLVAYPQSYIFPEIDEKGHLEKWQGLYKRILLTQRSYPNLLIDTILDKYTEGWKEKEKYDFIQWFKAENNSEHKLYKSFSRKEYNMTRYAAPIDFSDEEQLRRFKQKLLSRIQSADKVLQQIFDQGLIGKGPNEGQKVEYLSNILQKLKTEVMKLQRPALVASRCKHAVVLLKKAGFAEGASILEGGKEIFAEYCLVKTAASPETIEQLERIRDYLVKETSILSFDRIKNLIKIIDYFDNHNLNYSEPLKKAINTLLKPLESASNEILEVISSLNKIIQTNKQETIENAKPQV